MIRIPKQLQNEAYRFIKVRSGAKNPSDNEWTDGNSYRYNEKTFREYLKTASGYGVCTGYGQLVIIDCDNPEIGRELIKKLPSTFTVRTPKSHGYHLYYIIKEWKKKVVLYKGKIHQGEIQAKGQFCVGTGSFNAEVKNTYKIVDHNEIATISKESLLTAVDGYYNKNDIMPERKILGSLKPHKYDITRLIDIRDFILLSNGEYQGANPFIGSTGGKNFNINAEKNIFHDWRNEIGGKTTDLIALKENLISYDDFVLQKRQGKELPGHIYDKTCMLGREKYDLPIPERKLSLFIVQNKQEYLNVEGIVEYIKARHAFVTIKDSTGNKPQMYIYEDGYYIMEGRARLEIIIKALFHDYPWKTYYKNEIMDYMKTENVVERDSISPPCHLINLNNGVYNLKTRKLMAHNPQYMFLYKIPIDYKLNAKCPEILQYFSSTLESDFVKMSQELFGYCMYLRYTIHGIFYLFGPGGNGKSVWIHLLTAMLGGKSNVSNKSLHKIAKDRFTSAQLYGKLANVSGEMSSSMLADTSMPKQLSSGDVVAGEHKGYDSFDFPNRAKIISATNEMYYSKDKTDGWLQRQYVIPFCKQFRDVDGLENPDLKYQLTDNKREMEGLLLWALKGLHRLLESNKFTYPGDHILSYKLSIKPEYKFVDSCLEYKPDMEKGKPKYLLTFKEIYTQYSKWSIKYHVPISSRDMLARALTYRGYHSKDVRIKGQLVKVRDFVKLIPEPELNFEAPKEGGKQKGVY